MMKLAHAEPGGTRRETARKIHDALIRLLSEATRAGLPNVPNALWIAAKLTQKQAEDAKHRPSGQILDT